MENTNFQKDLDSLISSLNPSKKQKLLLHACCGPCSSYVIEYLSQYFDITILYYNPNIYPQKEYERRLQELIDFLPRFPEAIKNNVKLIIHNYNQEDFYNAIRIKESPELADEQEKGERCRRCYEFRLKRAFSYAVENSFDYFCTTLSISPFKDSLKINEIGFSIDNEKTKWLPSDFKKKGGFKRSLEISSEYNLYRQQYCGCIYSKTNTEIARNSNISK